MRIIAIRYDTEGGYMAFVDGAPIPPGLNIQVVSCSPEVVGLMRMVGYEQESQGLPARILEDGRDIDAEVWIDGVLHYKTWTSEKLFR